MRKEQNNFLINSTKLHIQETQRIPGTKKYEENCTKAHSKQIAQKPVVKKNSQKQPEKKRHTGRMLRMLIDFS